jgi:hypothetical protein
MPDSALSKPANIEVVFSICHLMAHVRQIGIKAHNKHNNGLEDYSAE